MTWGLEEVKLRISVYHFMFSFYDWEELGLNLGKGGLKILGCSWPGTGHWLIERIKEGKAKWGTTKLNRAKQNETKVVRVREVKLSVRGISLLPASLPGEHTDPSRDACSQVLPGVSSYVWPRMSKWPYLNNKQYQKHICEWKRSKMLVPLNFWDDWRHNYRYLQGAYYSKIKDNENKSAFHFVKHTCVFFPKMGSKPAGEIMEAGRQQRQFWIYICICMCMHMYVDTKW